MNSEFLLHTQSDKSFKYIMLITSHLCSKFSHDLLHIQNEFLSPYHVLERFYLIRSQIILRYHLLTSLHLIICYLRLNSPVPNQSPLYLKIIWRLNNTLLNNQQIAEEIKKEIKICIEMNENENTATQNLWDTVKAVLRGKCIAMQAYLKKQEKKSNKQPNSTPKATRKGRNEEPQGQQKERNLKNQGRNKCKRNKRDHSKNQQSQKLVL